MGFFRRLFSAIGGFISGIFATENLSVEEFHKIADDLIAAKANIEREIAAVKAFKFDPRWKSRVISVPQAIENIKALQDVILHDVTDKLQKLYDPIHELLLVWQNPTGTAEDPQGAVSSVARLSSAVRELNLFIGKFAEAVHAVLDLTDIFTNLRQQVEQLDALFLQQGNSRKAITEKSRIRVGALHPQ